MADGSQKIVVTDGLRRSCNSAANDFFLQVDGKTKTNLEVSSIEIQDMMPQTPGASTWVGKLTVDTDSTIMKLKKISIPILMNIDTTTASAAKILTCRFNLGQTAFASVFDTETVAVNNVTGNSYYRRKIYEGSPQLAEGTRKLIFDVNLKAISYQGTHATFRLEKLNNGAWTTVDGVIFSVYKDWTFSYVFKLFDRNPQSGDSYRLWLGNNHNSGSYSGAANYTIIMIK